MNSNKRTRDNVFEYGMYELFNINIMNKFMKIPKTQTSPSVKTQICYTCDACNKEFISKKGYTYHMLRHSNSEPFKCKTCDYTCPTSSRLSDHMRVHTGEKPFSCKLCKHTFTQVGNLIKHMLVHNKVYRYKCEVCYNRKFRFKCELKYHNIKHHLIKN